MKAIIQSDKSQQQSQSLNDHEALIGGRLIGHACLERAAEPLLVVNAAAGHNGLDRTYKLRPFGRIG